MRGLIACVVGGVLASVVAGCALDRHGIGASSREVDGATLIERDAAVEPMDGGSVDAAVTRVDGGPFDAGLDAGPPCPIGECCPACTAGYECDGTSCVPIPPCGGESQACCGSACSEGTLTCERGVCVRCGTAGLACCGGTCSDGSSCNGTTCEAACGGLDQPCCSGRCTAPGHYCGPLTGTCRQCGLRYAFCCAGGMCTEGSCIAGVCG